MFRVGDIVERVDFDIVRKELTGKQYTVVSINSTGTHISIDDTGYRYLASQYKLIKPVWKVGDTARVVKDTVTGHEFKVVGVSANNLFDTSNLRSYWHRIETCERIALAPVPSDGPIKHAFKGVVPDEPELFINANDFTLQTPIAREMEIPTYLYDVVEVKPRLIPGNVGEIEMVQRWSVRLEIESLGNTVAMHNIDHVSLDAERLRKLAKLCTDLADLMG